MYDAVANDSVAFYKMYYAASGTPYIPYDENKPLQQYVRSVAKVTAETYINMANTTAFVMRNASGKTVVRSIAKTYQDAIDQAITAVATGTEDYCGEIRRTIKGLADSGIRTVDYESGYSRRLDTAVRQNILDGVKAIRQGISDQVGEEFGADGREIDYHSNPRPTHAEMGGKQYAIGKARTVDGKYYPSFSTVEALLSDYNCLHTAFSIILGVSTPNYSDDELEELYARDSETFEYDGKQYTGYEATQVQRRLESAIRASKDRANIAKAAGDDLLRREEQARINHLTRKYNDFSRKSGLPTKMERARVRGFRGVKEDKNLTFIKNDAIIKKQSGLPKKVTLPDEKLKHTVDVRISEPTKNLLLGLYGVVPEESDLTEVYVMAGKDTCVPIRDLRRLYATYGMAPQDCQKKSGVVTSQNFRYVIHWYESNGLVPKDEIKIKGFRFIK